MDLNQFIVTGINYKKTDVSVRGQFAVSPEQYISILTKATALEIKEIFVLSTCNRTELYAVTNNANLLVDLLCSETAGDAETFQSLCYCKQGQEAIEHIFSVGAGLDSQILGDYEIVGQMKTAIRIAKEQNRIGAFMERLFNTVLQSSKVIKNKTALSGGTVSVSFAAIQFLKEKVTSIPDKKIVLLGTGKIGRNTCKNLVDYLGTHNITLINRTDEKANELAEELQLHSAGYDDLDKQVQSADIVIVATNAESPVIRKADMVNSNPKVLIDLSIPNNIEDTCGELPHITLVNVDDLSKINDATLQKRLAEVPKAQKIIATHIQEFHEWYCLRKHAAILRSLKQKLHDMPNCHLFRCSPLKMTTPIDEDTIQKVVNNMALKMRRQHQPGCNYIEAINDFMTTSVN
jgi:glutamyl-tRNA reductase